MIVAVVIITSLFNLTAIFSIYAIARHTYSKLYSVMCDLETGLRIANERTSDAMKELEAHLAKISEEENNEKKMDFYSPISGVSTRNAPWCN